MTFVWGGFLLDTLHFDFLKVYIVRASRLTEIDGAIGLLNLDLHVNPTDTSMFVYFSIFLF